MVVISSGKVTGSDINIYQANYIRWDELLLNNCYILARRTTLI